MEISFFFKNGFCYCFKVGFFYFEIDKISGLLFWYGCFFEYICFIFVNCCDLKYYILFIMNNFRFYIIILLIY